MAQLNVINSSKLVNCENNIKRPLADFPSDMWGDDFITFTPQDALEMERYIKEIEPLKEKVKRMLLDTSINISKIISLIDVIERLGVSYYYQDIIEELLNKLFKHVKNNNNLYDTVLQFRIFRQHGFNIPSDVFSCFMNKEGKFDNNIESDVKGILCLYEAAHLGTHGEHILDEALAFTTKFLGSNVASTYNQKLINHALKHPLHWTMPRVDTRMFISLYQDDEFRNETLLQFAKLDFNRLQLMYRQELCQVLKWWKDADLVRKLPYTRSSWVESHFCSIAMFYEPQYSFARVILAKAILFLTIVDDSYDAYGTFEELQLLTNAFERWDLSETNKFPAEYMKLVYDFVLKACDEVTNEITKRGKSYATQFAKDQVMEIIRSYFIEEKWVNEKYVPTFEEYMANGRTSSTASLLIVFSMIGMDEIVDSIPFQQVIQEPKALIASQTICRLTNDIGSHKAEQTRAHVASGVECYMKNYDMSREEAIQCLHEIIDDGSKDINKAFLDNNLHISLLKLTLNLVRLMFLLYEVDSDGYTHSFKFVKDEIFATYASPITI